MKKAFLVFVCLLLSLLTNAAFAADACVVLSSDIGPYRDGLNGFEKSFRGKVDSFVLNKDIAHATEVANNIKAHACEIVMVLGSNALKFLKIRVADKPIVYAMVLNPRAVVGEDENITGVHLESSLEASINAIHRVFPGATRIGIIYSPVLNEANIGKAKRAAQNKGLELVAISVKNIGEAVRAVPAIIDRSDVIWMISDAITSSSKVFEILLASSHRKGVPLFALSRKHVSRGALAALFTDYEGNGEQAGRMANKIAQGVSPKSIPDEYALKTGLVLNMGTAKKLGLDLPKNIVSEAVEIFK